jgi:hypothetical protein
MTEETAVEDLVDHDDIGTGKCIFEYIKAKLLISRNRIGCSNGCRVRE